MTLLRADPTLHARSPVSALVRRARAGTLLLVGPLSLVACVAAPELAGDPAPDGEGPRARNVIVVMTDDQGWGDLSLHGNPVLETPALDRLAAESVQLQQFYVHPVCTPTRAALFTGQHPQRGTAIDTYRGRAMLGPESITIAEVMGDAGWATGLFGKWHLGDCAPLRPMDQGFDRTVVHCGGGIGQPSDPMGGEGRYTNPVLQDQGRPREFEGYCTEVYFREAMAWMRTCKRAGEPFFCAITPNAPHTPLHDVPEDLYAKYSARDLSPEAFAGEPGWPATFEDEDKLARLFAMIEDIDRNMGDLVAFLDDEELAEDTLLLFLCDNGPQGRRWNQGLRAAKGDIHEGGVRSPLFARWPEGLEPRVQEAGYAAHLDLFPTILEACGVVPGREVALDGQSALELLRGSEDAVAASRERPLVIQWARGDYPVRGHHAFLRLGDEKLVQETRPWDELTTPPEWSPALYDLGTDPLEREDLAAARPARVAELTELYDAWYEDVIGYADWAEHLREPGAREHYLRLLYGPPAIRLGGRGAERVVLTRQDWRPAGNGWGSNGAWTVTFQDQRPWQVRVILQRDADPERVRVGVNSGSWTYVTREAAVPDGAREVVVEFPGHWRSGVPATVDVVQLGGKRDGQGPHQVVFER